MPSHIFSVNQEQVTTLMERKGQLKEEVGGAQQEVELWKEKYRCAFCRKTYIAVKRFSTCSLIHCSHCNAN